MFKTPWQSILRCQSAPLPKWSRLSEELHSSIRKTGESAGCRSVGRQFAQQLPLNGRSFQTLIELTPVMDLLAAIKREARKLEKELVLLCYKQSQAPSVTKRAGGELLDKMSG